MANNMIGENQGVHIRPLILASALTKALSHRIRTPLAVVSNDLSYYSTQLEDQEGCERAKRRCTEISTILKEASSLRKVSLEIESVEIISILKDVLKEYSLSANLDSSLNGYAISGDKALLVQSFKMLIDILSKLRDADSADKIPSFSAEKARDSIILHFSSPMHTILNSEDSCEEFTSFSELFSFALDSDSSSPPLLDAALWAQAGSIELKVLANELCGSICFQEAAHGAS